MGHINEKIDYVVTAFIVHKDKVLLIHHKKLDRWLAPGGHVELDEDTDQALSRELKEETGLRLGIELEVIQPNHYHSLKAQVEEVENTGGFDVKPLFIPWAMEIHPYPPLSGHNHIALVYVCSSTTDKVRLEEDAAHSIQWFSKQGLKVLDKTLGQIKIYGMVAIDLLNGV